MPMRRIRSPCCARAATGQAAAPPSSVMNERRLMAPLSGRGSYPTTPFTGTVCASQQILAADDRLGSRLCEKSHRQKKRRIVFFVVFSRRQLLALFVFKSNEIETEVLNPN